MADYKVPNLCGASPEFNAIQTQLDTTISNVIDGLEVDASTLSSTMDTNVNALVSDLKAMIPELPALPDINLQAQLTSLSSLLPGSDQYKTLLSDITTKFGSALTAGGYSLDTLVLESRTAITGGTDLCSVCPNFEVPAAGGDAVENAIEVLQPISNSLAEDLSVQLANPNVKDAINKAVTAFNNFFRSSTETGKLPTKDKGSFTVTTNSTTIVSSDGSPWS